APDEEVHRFVNDLERRVGTYLLGRRMYETLLYWEDPPGLEAEPAVIQDFAAIWRGADKLVYSTTLERASSARTRIERSFDPHAIRQMKDSARQDVAVGGPHLAAEAIRAGLVDEFHLIVVPVVVGGGNRALPDGVHLDLELVDERRFQGGAVYLHYRPRA
ncbi:MAG: deaminase, partial [Chloroflexi bacterium]